MRGDDDELLEPILPKSPPTAPLHQPTLLAETDQQTVVLRPQNENGMWERRILVACAVAATLCLVVIALRLTSIAKDQRVQTCQARIFAAEQLSGFDGSTGRRAQERYAQQLADCVGLDRTTVESNSD